MKECMYYFFLSFNIGLICLYFVLVNSEQDDVRMFFKEFCYNKLYIDWLNKSKENYFGNLNSFICCFFVIVKRYFVEIFNVDVLILKKVKFCEFCVNELFLYCIRGNEYDYCDSERFSFRRGNENEYSKELMERVYNKVDQIDNFNLFKE